MVNIKLRNLNCDGTIHTKDLSGKSEVEIERILKDNPDYKQVRKLGAAFTVLAPNGTILVFWDENQGTWIGVPIKTTGGFHNLQIDGSYAPKEQ
mgnify:CR=1 FL=1|jgi:hypothetical protein